MNNLEKFWQSLTEAERVALVVLADVLTNRQAVVESVSAAFNTAGPKGLINDGLKDLDSTALRPEAQMYLERFLEQHVVEHFDELYRELFARI